MDRDKFLESFEKVSEAYHVMSAEATRIHQENTITANTMLPEIKKVIVEKIFKKGMCFPGSWRHENMGPGTGGHYNLLGLHAPRKLTKTEEFPGPIHTKDDLDIKWVEEQILNRYFEYYKPNYERLEKELGINLKQT